MGRSPRRTSPRWLSLLIEAFGEMGFRVLAQVGPYPQDCCRPSPRDSYHASAKWLSHTLLQLSPCRSSPGRKCPLTGSPPTPSGSRKPQQAAHRDYEDHDHRTGTGIIRGLSLASSSQGHRRSRTPPPKPGHRGKGLGQSLQSSRPCFESPQCSCGRGPADCVSSAMCRVLILLPVRP